jgi:peptide deformylase
VLNGTETTSSDVIHQPQAEARGPSCLNPLSARALPLAVLIVAFNSLTAIDKSVVKLSATRSFRAPFGQVQDDKLFSSTFGETFDAIFQDDKHSNFPESLSNFLRTMAILPIRIWGDPILRRRAQAVDRVTNVERKLIRDMIETMEAADGAGLAAPQVGVSKRIFVFRRGDEIHALINPRIIRRPGERQVGSEGCLSIPGVQAKVSRHAQVVIVGRDENGKAVEYECADNDDQGRAATCVQHELDHLDGVMYVEKVEPDTLSWLIEAVDEDGEDDVILRKTTIEAIKAAYAARQLPPDLHILDQLRERIMKK